MASEQDTEVNRRSPGTGRVGCSRSVTSHLIPRGLGACLLASSRGAQRSRPDKGHSPEGPRPD